MRTWRRVSLACLCGRCGEPILAQTPALFVRLDKVRRELVRCASCAGESVPDLPAVVERSSRTKRMESMSSITARLDWKAIQAEGRAKDLR